jgi:hypothetical protein
MSTFVDKAINPKTRQTQEAWFIDDFYGQRLTRALDKDSRFAGALSVRHSTTVSQFQE